jgi:hypothetical protein
MEGHTPKPSHGWREFLKEYATIVIGVLTALGAEQSVEWLHWRQEVAQGRQHLRAEISFDEKVYAHRTDVAACVHKNLADLTVLIDNLDANKNSVISVPRFVSPQNGPINHEIWNSLSAAQVLVHFPKDELVKFSQFYQMREDAEYFMDRESRAWRQLHLLEGNPSRLSRQDISTLRVALGDAEEMSQGVATISRDQLSLARALGLALPKPDASWRPECKAVLGTL